MIHVYHITVQIKVSPMSLEVIILAAGQGKRMQSSLPKVLHPIGGKTMLQHVVETCLALNPHAIHIVVGSGREMIQTNLTAALGEKASIINWVVQQQQLGTGHAVSQAIPFVDPDSNCLTLFGDVPLVDAGTLMKFCQITAPLTILTAKPDNTFGLGRIMRDESEKVIGIVEQKDATPAERAIPEINSGIMLGQARLLDRWLRQVSNNNKQGEYYLTDIVALAVKEEAVVSTVLADNPELLLGINSKSDLAIAERTYQRDQARQLMEAGVTLMDPARVDIRGQAAFGSDCSIDINVVLEGSVIVGNHASIGPNCVIRNARIGDHCRINANSLIEHAEIGHHCRIGPFARLRPDTELADHVAIGNFVEVKKSQIGTGSKVNHLAYIGDSTVGTNTNIGAGVITCNYDGANKHQTIIGDNAFIGSDSQLVAPVRIGDGVTVGAGSTITRDIESDALVVSRAPQKSIPDWKRPIKK